VSFILAEKLPPEAFAADPPALPVAGGAHPQAKPAGSGV